MLVRIQPASPMDKVEKSTILLPTQSDYSLEDHTLAQTAQARFISLVISRDIRSGRRDISAGFSYSFFDFPLIIIIPSWLHIYVSPSSDL
jgi:hypothetical protein